jgi:hypothetical protein
MKMMKKIAILFTLFTFSFCFSQQSVTITIDWKEKLNYGYGEKNISVPQFQKENFNYNHSSKELFYIKKISSNNLIDENSLLISNLVYETIDETKLGSIPKNSLPSSIKATIKNQISRDLINVELKLHPLINDQNTVKRLKSFSYTFSNETSARANQLQNITSSVTNSVLASGTWFKFYVVKSGVYIINKSFLEELGINTTFLNPKKIKIYGSGGKMAPLNNNIPYPIDLEENAIQVIGENDGVFNDSDYALFYGEGVDNWSEENQTNINLYSSKAYYYINIDGADGKRMSTLIEPTEAATVTLTKYDDYHFHEVDLTNIGRLGRTWFGEDFSNDDDQSFIFNIPNISTTDPLDIRIHVGGKSFAETKFNVKLNNQNLGSGQIIVPAIDDGIEATHATLIATATATPLINVNLKYDNSGVPTSKGHLDFINIKSKSNLKGFGKQYRFQYNLASSSTGVVAYQFSTANNIKEIWEITDIYNVSKLQNNNQSNFSFKSNLGSERKFIVYDANDLYIPLKDAQSRIFNQNLKGTVFKNSQGNFQDVDYLIITPFALGTQAEKLAKFHRTYSQLSVKVVFLENIYQEFSSGKQDIAGIRNFVKYVYQNASTPSKKVKYLNLFGDASFDFKDRIPNNTNIVPIYLAVDSYSAGESSFASDDFFTFMDNNEGNSGSPDIAVGRMLVSSATQAEQMINKIIQYHDLKSYGNWRNNYVAISDDTDKDSDITLQENQNDLTDVIYAQKTFLNFRKILLDSYQQEASAGGNRYPKAREEIRNSFERGALVFNYLGHGGEDGLTAERIWDKFDGYNFNNTYRYPLFITLTCDFSKFDNPYRPTAGEYTYWNPKGGAIGMITTVRTIGQSGAESFNNLLASKLFAYGSDNYPSIGEALRQAKSLSSNSGASRVIFYLGDPALKLAIPRPQIVLTKVNDVPITEPIDDFKALSYIKLSGEVRDEIGTLLTDYNGELSVNIFDKNYTRTTFNNDNFSPPISFNNIGETIFRGNASINNGKFEFGFIVPKDIKIPLNNGRISFYSKRNQILLDKNGFNLDIKVGGINNNAVADVTAPKVRLYMNDESFVNGGITNQSPFFLAFLEDEHGINTASGIGHDIVAILDGDETKPYILNDYYETELDDFTKGKIRFPFRNLSVGLHTITLKAWDVYNNFISAEIQFVVVGDETMTLTNVLNYPNPFVNYTQFWFTHNRPYETLNVQVQIMTITGKVVKTINQSTLTEGFLSREITWDGKDDFGDKIGKGVYIYKLTVKSSLTGEYSEKIEKLVLL